MTKPQCLILMTVKMINKHIIIGVIVIEIVIVIGADIVRVIVTVIVIVKMRQDESNDDYFRADHEKTNEYMSVR